jgi:hypothetical protein
VPSSDAGVASTIAEHEVPIDGPEQRTVGRLTFTIKTAAATKLPVPTPDVSAAWDTVF